MKSSGCKFKNKQEEVLLKEKNCKQIITLWHLFLQVVQINRLKQ